LVLGGAIEAADACEASLETAAVEVTRDHAIEEAAPEAIPALEEILPGSIDRLGEGLEQRVQGHLGGPAPPVCGCLHGRMRWRVACRRTENSASWQAARGVSHEHATLREVLAELDSPGDEVRRLLAAPNASALAGDETPAGRWLRELGRRLLGEGV